MNLYEIMVPCQTNQGKPIRTRQHQGNHQEIPGVRDMKGINAHRLSREPLEKHFADAWAKKNKGDKVLKYILDRSQSNNGVYPPTEVEQEVAATIIQWLGSHVGQNFLKDVWLGQPIE